MKGHNLIGSEAATRDVIQKKTLLKTFTIFTGKHLCWSLFLIKLQVLRPVTHLKETPTPVFSCKCSKIFKNTQFEEHLRTADSVGFTNRKFNL